MTVLPTEHRDPATINWRTSMSTPIDENQGTPKEPTDEPQDAHTVSEDAPLGKCVVVLDGGLQCFDVTQSACYDIASGGEFRSWTAGESC